VTDAIATTHLRSRPFGRSRPVVGPTRRILGEQAPPPGRASGRAVMIKGDRVIHKARYSHPVSAVWHALTDPAALSTWLMPNDFAPTVGQRFSSTRAQTLASSKVKFSMFEPPSLLRCRWTIEGVPTTVTMRLEADGDGTLLELEHSRLTPEARPHFDDGWSHKLQADLGLVLTGERDPALSTSEEGLHRYTSLENDRRQRAEGRQGGADPT